MYGLQRLGRAVLDAVAPARCAACGDSGRVLCEACVAAIEATPPPLIAGARAAFVYGDEVRAVVHRGKFGDCRAALRVLSWLGAARLEPAAGAVVAPVPLARRRGVERGYNQAEVVARAMADFHRLQMHPLLTRTRDTQAQSRLDRAGRIANVAGAFAAAGAAGATVWLIDDVLTTGATTTAARDALLAAGARRVEVAVLAAVL